MNDSRSRWLALAVLAIAQFMVVLDVTIVNVALPAIQTDLGFSRRGPAVGRQRLHARVRRPAAARRAGERPARAPPALPRRPRAVRRRLAGRRLRDLLRGPDRGARGPGHRRRAALARGARAADRDLPGGPRAQHRARRLGRPGRHRRDAGRGRRRRAGRLARLGMDLLRQRAGRDRRAGHDAAVRDRVAAATAPAASTSPAPCSAPPACSRSSTASSAPTPRAGARPRCWGCSARRSCCWARSSTSSRAPPTRSSRCRLFRVRGLSVSALALALNGGAFLGMFFMTALYLQQVHGDSALDAGAHFVPMGIAAIALRGRRRAARDPRRHARGLPGRLGDRRRRVCSCSAAPASARATPPTSCPAWSCSASGCRWSASPTRSPPSPRSRTRTRAPRRASSPPPSRSAARSGWRSSRPRRPRA